MTTPPSQYTVDSVKPIDIDETEELERMLSLKHRETLIRGMGKEKAFQIKIRCFLFMKRYY